MNVSPLQASRYWVSLRHFIHYQCDCCKPRLSTIEDYTTLKPKLVVSLLTYNTILTHQNR
nr:MAG TPA: Protein of unknown function (DUF2757) [Caudoviricetes sp.]